MIPSIQDLIQVHKESMPWLEKSVILAVRSGSHAYGTSLPTSDLDFKGVAIPPKPYFYGFVKKFEQAEQRQPYDSVIYDIRKFCNLAADCNPSIMEVLFVDESDVVSQMQGGMILRDCAHAFLSKKAKHTFSGYAMSQLKRIQRHYAWLTNPPKHEPSRKEFGLINRTTIPADQRAAAMAIIKSKMDSWNPDLSEMDPAARIATMEWFEKTLLDVAQGDPFMSAARGVGLSDEVIYIIQQERSYNNAQNEWKQYQTWKASRNPARAELEAKWGYDTKHGMHLVRLLRMGYEILTEGKVFVKRPDAKELLSIRHGAWTYAQMVEYAEQMDAKMAVAEQASSLPRAPDRDFLDALCMKVIERTTNG
jgi:predicted nucleotidyltransferase